jgi:hypothetical protein
MFGIEPTVEDVEHLDPPGTEAEATWRLLAAIAGVALDRNTEGRARHRTH